MKKFALALSISMFAGTASFAGNAEPVVMDGPKMVEEDHGSMGAGSTGWLIPILAIAALAVVVNNGD